MIRFRSGGRCPGGKYRTIVVADASRKSYVLGRTTVFPAIILFVIPRYISHSVLMYYPVHAAIARSLAGWRIYPAVSRCRGVFGGWSKHLQSCETSALIMMIRRRRPHACRLPTPACHRAAQVGVCRVNRRPRSRPPSAPCRGYRGCDVVSCHWLTFSAAGRPAAAAGRPATPCRSVVYTARRGAALRGCDCRAPR